MAALAAVAALSWWPLAGTASAQSFTWTGQGSTPNWSNTSNWSPSSSPSGATSLTFGALPPSCAETINPTCYVGTNDVSGVSVDSISIDDAEQYDLTGDQVSLGAGGLTAAPSTATSAEPAFIAPLALTANQAWSINGPLHVGQIAGGGHSLSLRLVSATYGQYGISTMFLTGDAETSSFDATGAGAVEILSGGRLNADGAPVVFGDQTELWPVVSTTVGPLSTAPGTTLLLTGNIGGSPATLTVLGTANIGSVVQVGLYGRAGASELAAQRVVARGEFLFFLEPTANNVCPALNAGQSYVLVSSTQPITGQFEPNGDTLQIYRDCNAPIDDEALISDTAHTVKATVIAIPPKPPIQAWLKRILKPTGKHASIPQILARRGYAFVSTPPAHGIVNVQWTTISKHKTVVVAIGGQAVGPRKTSLRIRITPAGRNLLRHATKLKVTAGAGFSYPGGGARKTFRLG